LFYITKWYEYYTLVLWSYIVATFQLYKLFVIYEFLNLIVNLLSAQF